MHLPEPDADATKRVREIEATLSDDGAAQIDIRTETSGALAAEERQRYHAKGTQRERMARDLSGDFPGFEIGSGGRGSRDERSRRHRAARENARARQGPTLGRRDGPDLSIPVGPASRLVASFASLSARQQDIRLHVQSTLDDELVIHLPANFKTKNLPESMQQETPFGTFSIRAEASGGKISLKTRVSFQKRA